MPTAYHVDVIQKELKNDLYYDNQVVLSYTIQYPHFKSKAFMKVLHEINQFYENKAKAFLYHSETKMYKQAVAQYMESKANNYPIMKYESMLVYTITFNENCTISLYNDNYEYTGGAHGITVRSSDNWELVTGRKYRIEDFFPQHFDYSGYIFHQIYDQIAQLLATGENQFFDDYQKLVVDNFKLSSFYITPKGIVIYYQQYDISPYSSGIVEFLIPFENGLVMPPACLSQI